uniref:SERTA domain containing 2a n=1 Tax=Cyprinus carpio TaxID=7962 RepID=A0A8C1UE28_CYPCA
MLGKGLKRKLEQEEENGVMKMSCPQEASPACYWLQRQTVLNLSLLKLHSRPGHTEPGLARWVLITNTLRRIQDVPAPQSFPSGVETHSEGSLTPVSGLEEDRHLFLCLSPSISRQQPPSSSVIKDSFTSALAEIEDLCPTVGITTLFSTEMGRSLSLFGHTPPLLADFSLDDFLLTEIDSLLFDNIPCGSSLSGSSGASKVVSMVTDDLVKTLAGYGNGGMSQSALPSNQTFKLDLNELDHIMEVLVGS